MWKLKAPISGVSSHGSKQREFSWLGTPFGLDVAHNEGRMWSLVCINEFNMDTRHAHEASSNVHLNLHLEIYIIDVNWGRKLLSIAIAEMFTVWLIILGFYVYLFFSPLQFSNKQVAQEACDVFQLLTSYWEKLQKYKSSLPRTIIEVCPFPKIFMHFDQ